MVGCFFMTVQDIQDNSAR